MGTEIQQAVRNGLTPGSPNVRPGSELAIRADFRPERSETGVWIGIFAIVMSFAAFTSAMIVRQAAAQDWKHFELPRILYVNTVILLVSSLALGLARNRLSSIAGSLGTSADKAKVSFSEGMNWLYVTLTLGGLFVVGQVLAWRTLAAQDLFLSTNPSSSFYYIFTAMHGLHVLGGIAGLAYVIGKLWRTNGTAQTTGLPAVCLYWHFMGGLWVYLLVLLLART